jgi:hypothetical protein
MVGTPVRGPSDQHSLDAPRDQRTPGEVADLLKTRFRPSLPSDKKPKEMSWVAACLTSEPSEEMTPK